MRRPRAREPVTVPPSWGQGCTSGADEMPTRGSGTLRYVYMEEEEGEGEGVRR